MGILTGCAIPVVHIARVTRATEKSCIGIMHTADVRIYFASN